MLLYFAFTTIFSASSTLAAILVTKVAPAPAATTTVTCTVLGCPPVDLKGDGLFSMDQSDFTDTLICEWRFPLQPIVEGNYNLVSPLPMYTERIEHIRLNHQTTGLLISGDPTEVPAAALAECVTSTINAPAATAR